MPTIAELSDSLVQADAAGDTQSAQTLADAIRRVSSSAAPVAPPPQQVAQAPQQTQPPQGMSTAMGGLSRNPMSGASVVEMMTPQERHVARQFMAGVARYAPPIAATIWQPELGPLFFATMGVTGAGGEAAGQFIEGKSANYPDIIKSGVTMGLPIPGASAAKFLSLGGAINAVKGAAALGFNTFLGDYAGRVAKTGKVQPYDSFKDAFKDTTLPMIIGSVAFPVAGRFLNNATTMATASSNRAALADIGVKNPELGDILPKEYGVLQQRVAQVSPALANRISQSRSPIAQAFYSLIGDAPANEKLATQLQPIIGRFDKLEAEFQQAQDAARKASEAAGSMLKDTQLPVPMASKMLAAATADELNAVSQQAQALIKQQVAADSIGVQTGKAEAIRGTVSNLFNARGRAADAMMKATGIDINAPMFDKQALLSAATDALGSDAESTAGKSILKTISEYGKSGKGEVIDNIIKAAGNQSQLSASDLKSFMANRGADQLSLQDFRQMRNRISEGFSGVVGENTMDNAERLASNVYAAMGQESKKAIATNLGPESADAYNQFLDFWRKTSQLRDSGFGRALLNGEVSDSTVKAMATKLATGQVDEIQNFKRFVVTIGQQNPDVARMAYNAMGSAVKNSFLEQASTNGVVDYSKLGGLLQSAASKKGAPFPVEMFGLGDVNSIKGWNKAIGEFSASDLTPEAIQNVMESPQVQQILKVGGDQLAPRLRTILATNAFQKRVLDSYTLTASGATAPARQAYQDAISLANRAGLSADDAKAAFDAAANNPLLAAFKGKSMSLLTNEAGVTGGNGTISGLLRGMKREEAKAVLSSLNDVNPELGSMVERRLLANEFDKFSRPEVRVPGENYQIDANRVRSYFNPPSHEWANSDAKWLMDVLGAQTVNKFKNFATSISAFDDATRASMMGAASSHAGLNAIQIGGTMESGSLSSGYFQKQLANNLITNFYNKGKFGVLSAMIKDDGLANVLYRNGGDIGSAIAGLPTVKAYLLLKDKQIVNELGKEKNQSP